MRNHRIRNGSSFIALLGGMALFSLVGCSGKEASAQDAAGAIGTAEGVSDKPEEGSSQTAEVAGVPAQKLDYAQFVLDGYEILDTAFGDLNHDNREDVVMVLKLKAERQMFDEVAEGEDEAQPRPLLLLTQQPDQQLKLAARNDHVVMCAQCGGVFGDPWDGITIKNGYFSIEHYGGSNWRWTHIITFKHDPAKGGWFLHKVGGDSFHTSEPEKVETAVRTTKDFGIVAFEDYTDESM